MLVYGFSSLINIYTINQKYIILILIVVANVDTALYFATMTAGSLIKNPFGIMCAE